MAPRPYLSTAAAIVGAAVIVAGTPAIMPHGDLQVSAQAPTPTKISTAQYELTALSDITLQGIADAYYNGWGGYIGSGFDPTKVYAANADGSAPFASDPYFPGINGPVVATRNADGVPTGYYYDQSPVYATGVGGATYYLISQALDDKGLFADPVYHYYYEVAAAGGNAFSAALYVATAQAFGGTSSLPAQLVKTVFIDGVLPNVQATVIGLATLVPKFNVGPVVVGGGNLASLYFTGSTIDGSYSYGNTGLSAIAGYIAYSIANPPTTTPTTSTTLAAAAKTAAPEVKALVATDTTVTDGTTAATDTTAVVKKVTSSAKVEKPAAEDVSASVADAVTAAPDTTTTTTTSTVTTPKVKSSLSDLGKSFDNILGGGKSDKAKAAADGAKSASDSGSTGAKSTGKKGTKSASTKSSSD
ncbi:hypothetical protein [Mycolicibacterium komossense]|jgi:hypothetical protein|uniref:PE-PPE domain-containing protein n=1 Tax=Mycolicibacterium komossense TaxID=1779 RepID=A0ABT3CE40_9MYCO|nr:hypothetical protein [Mycolicibacterium komossense]MCV7227758.1 hypothetical protein [Mycolicibacterium komossense]